MSLMMCKRYRLSGRQGRYIVLMCCKYSNLNSFRSNFLSKIHDQRFQEEQRLCSLLAHEAIHNVLRLVDSSYLQIKSFGEPLTDENSLGIQSYKTILNLGFWKKLVYILEKRQSLQLCLKFFDLNNFQIIMKAFMTQQEKIDNHELLDNWLIKTQLKAYMLEKAQVFSDTQRYKDFRSRIDDLQARV